MAFNEKLLIGAKCSSILNGKDLGPIKVMNVTVQQVIHHFLKLLNYTYLFSVANINIKKKSRKYYIRIYMYIL